MDDNNYETYNRVVLEREELLPQAIARSMVKDELEPISTTSQYAVIRIT